MVEGQVGSEIATLLFGIGFHIKEAELMPFQKTEACQKANIHITTLYSDTAISKLIDAIPDAHLERISSLLILMMSRRTGN